ncbi:TPA: hypothetical protein L5647_005763 [Pseudomonas aeruginosa]|uniref:hypothetical protein n=1 Tax=Pseudomonas aeruginosa TaxID=287 RepID=UPI00106870AC|nr:hypothetical protein [Pseudomonas aeruginosa]MBG7077185.1 hypothetical protein [Pseudomonas aeruginosa]MCU9299578.1 hypothetical protein [Pseudomonas aeruginosa]MDU0549039.1 hypothetical protein [Pseudomonas aeruginosa]TEG28118.1 hypothetical protein IPC1341_27650 [Pseudomonas aeruginosa]HBP1966563.1 hypothetical protein [Pseudomonas aeruginosa]
MAVVFFLPWVAAAEELRIADICLMPYERGRLPGELLGIPQAAFDGVLGNYGDRGFGSQPSHPVRQAALVIWNDDTPGMEVSDVQIQQRLVQSSYLAFSALAGRSLCSAFEYYNADTLQVVAQRFDIASPAHSCMTTRRRDGGTQNMLAGSGGLKFIRPYHVDNRAGISIDTPLLEALLKLPDGELKERIDEAIVSFLRANTDAPSMDERSELILMRVAIDTLLNVPHDKAAFRRAINEHFDELPNPPIWHKGSLDESWWREHWDKNVNRPLDAWVHDFCAARNAAAHGPANGEKGSIWPRHNHLIFSTWLLPLIVKKLLVQAGLYEFSAEDKVARAGFEVFLAHDLLAATDEHENKVWWQVAESALFLPLFAERLRQACE